MSLHLSLVPTSGDDEADELSSFVRAVRRDMARLLRALQASGRGLATLPDPVTTRLAHVDAVTARYLIEPQEETVAEARSSANSMRALERWIVARLPAAELAQVRAQAISVRIEDDELAQPLLRTTWTSDELRREDEGHAAPDGQRLRHGLARLDDAALAQTCLRLGVRVDPLPWPTDERGAMNDTRLSAEESVLQTLVDGHLLAILIATLPGEAHRLLAALVRGEIDDSTLARLELSTPELHQSIGATSESPSQVLRSCALAFGAHANEDPRLWVPVELQHRIDGVLRAFGV